MSGEGVLGETEAGSSVGKKFWIWFQMCWACNMYQGGGGQVVGCLIGPRRDVEAPGKMRAVKRKVK